MLSTFECPYCASCENRKISNFFSAVLDAKTTVYQCEECLSLFDFPREVKRSELQKRLSDLQEDAQERMAVAVAANTVGVLNNQELVTTIAKIQRKKLTAQLSLIRQQIAIISPANKELLDELERQESDIQIELIEVQRQELQRRLSDLQENTNEEIEMAAASGVSLDTENQTQGQTVVVVYGYDSLMNRIPIDSFWTNPNNFRYPNPEPRTLINVESFDTSAVNPFLNLMTLFFGIFQIILGLWLLLLGFGF